MIKRVCILFTIAIVAACTKAQQDSSMPIGIASNITANPILSGLPVNPLLHITIFIPDGHAPVKYNSILCTLNSSAVADLQNLQVYSTGVTPAFGTGNMVTTVAPSDSSFAIPVNLSLTGGINHFWIAGELKPTASLAHQVVLHATQFVTSTNSTEAVHEYGNFGTRIGMALRKSGDNGVDTYRIPGLTTTDKGTLIAVYDIRYNSNADLPANINVGLSRSFDGGQTWEPMRVIMNMGQTSQNGIGDPSVLFDPSTKTIWVAALWAANGHSIAQSAPGLSTNVSGQYVLVNSTDDGLTWSAPINITPQVKDPATKILFQGPGRGIAMSDGKLVFPSQYWDASNVPYSTLIYSTDHGASWVRGSTGAKPNTTECQVVETAPGTLMLNMRDQSGNGYRSVATTANLGTNWTADATSGNTLPDPVCMASLIKANVNIKGVMTDVLFFCNPNVSAAPRAQITVKASLDLGATWLPANQLLIDERPCYGYSCLTKIDNNTLGLLYEGTKELYFVHVPVSQIIK
ncbi:MAG: exo-alpha-sialidase [Bacteroidetes bacterium]|nr:exo-alpha-sialidase [Bacteroidota bacterium]MBS1539053.1 exo-alpha-sialidase [Bacteroidota bacterium]